MAVSRTLFDVVPASRNKARRPYLRPMPAEHIDCLVIGGGQAGLGVSRELGARGVEHLVLEQGRIGDSWRSQRWDSFALNTPAWMNRLAGRRRAGRIRTVRVGVAVRPGPGALRLRQRLPVREGVTVRALDAGPAGEAISVATDDGVFEARGDRPGERRRRACRACRPSARSCRARSSSCTPPATGARPTFRAGPCSSSAAGSRASRSPKTS